jgi:hypothetical protein
MACKPGRGGSFELVDWASGAQLILQRAEGHERVTPGLMLEEQVDQALLTTYARCEEQVGVTLAEVGIDEAGADNFAESSSR